MKIVNKEQKDNRFEFDVELDFDAWKKKYEIAYKKVAKDVQVQGFRKGHVPNNIIEQKINLLQVCYHAIEDIQNEVIDFTIKSDDFKKTNCIEYCSAIDIVKIDNDKIAPTLKICFDLMPEVLSFSKQNIKDITIPQQKNTPIDNQYIEQQIKMITKNDAMVSDKDGVVANGDLAVIDFKGFVDDKPFEGGEGKDYELEIGSKSFIDNFEQQLIGLKKGDKKTVNVTFPKNYGKIELANKPAKFEVIIKNVKSIEYPTITKKYLQKYQINASNKKELEEYIKNLMNQQSLIQYHDQVTKILNDQILKQAKLSYYPNSLVNMHSHQVLKQYESEAQKAGFKTLEAYKKALKFTDEKFNELVKSAAQHTLLIAITYEKLIKEYNLNVDEQDKKEYINKLTKYFNDANKAKDAYEKNVEYAKTVILREKLLKCIITDCKKK